MATPTSKPATAKPKSSAADSLLAAAKRGTGPSKAEVLSDLTAKDKAVETGTVECPACSQSVRLAVLEEAGVQLVVARVQKLFKALSEGAIEGLRPSVARGIRNRLGRPKAGE